MKKIYIILYVILSIILSSFAYATDFDIIAYYPFDSDGLNSLRDDNHLDIIGVINTTSKVGNGSLNLVNGFSHYAVNTSYINMSEIRTISYWVNLDSTSCNADGDDMELTIGDAGAGYMREYVTSFNYNGGWVVNTQDNISTWVMKTIVFGDGAGAESWLGNFLYHNDTETNDFTGWDSLTLGNWYSPNGAYTACGQYDNLVVSATRWTSSMIDEAWNSGNGLDFTTTGLPELPTGNLQILTSNSTGWSKYFQEGQDFNLFLNYTYSDNLTSIADGYCDITLQEGVHDVEVSNINVTLCSTCANNTFKNQIFAPDTTNATLDFTHFKACHDGIAQGDLQVNISCGNDVYSEIISPTAYPECDDGTADIFVNTSLCIATQDINISIYSDVNSARQKQISNIDFDREYSSLIMHNGTSVFYNVSSGLYYVNHTHEYYKHGTKNITAECKNPLWYLNATSLSNITIEEQAPLIFLDGIVSPTDTIYNAVDNVVLAYEIGTFIFDYSVIDDDLSFVNITLYNNTGGVLKSEQNGGDLIFNFSNELIRDFNQPFNITIQANDSTSGTSKGFLFNFSDTTPPVCNGFVDDSSNILNNTFYNFDVECSDDSFFSLNVSCDNGYENATEGLNVQAWNFTDSILINDSVTCSFEYCDGHTDAGVEIDAYSTGQEAIFDSKIHISSDTNYKKFEFKHKYDRVEFEFKTNAYTDRVNFTITSDEKIYIMGATSYIGWLVTGDYWIDFENDDVAFWKVEQITDTEVSIEIIFHNEAKSFKFKSVGKTNCVSDSIELIGQASLLETGKTEKEVQEFSSIPQALFWIFLTLFWFITMICSLTLKGVNGHRMGVFIILQMVLGLTTALGWIQNFSFMIGMAIAGVSLIVTLGGWN